VFDTILGGTILSTEDLFQYLAGKLSPRTILLAGKDPGIWQDFPECNQLVQNLTPQTYRNIKDKIGLSAAPDVTGGMGDKVEAMLKLIKNQPNLQVQIFSGMEPGNIIRALKGDQLGTILHS
jgi:isopentenyl phosphate kinase